MFQDVETRNWWNPDGFRDDFFYHVNMNYSIFLSDTKLDQVFLQFMIAVRL